MTARGREPRRAPEPRCPLPSASWPATTTSSIATSDRRTPTSSGCSTSSEPSRSTTSSTRRSRRRSARRRRSTSRHHAPSPRCSPRCGSSPPATRPARASSGWATPGPSRPAVIQRNVLEDPAWYTAYTPYQAEISQGRLEALLNFQTMVSELTGLPVANASLLDEATAAAEAMTMARRLSRAESTRFVVHPDTHPQTIAVLATRAEPVGIDLVVGDVEELDGGCFGALFSLPTSTGAVTDWRQAIEQVQAGGGLAVVATDLLACVLTVSPGQLGADIAVGSSQRFGVPMGFGGPHAAFIAARESAARALPGRIVGVSTDTAGRPALRLALQTREQHIRREKATSNICTAQVLLANIAGFYAAWHGPTGLARIAERVQRLASVTADALRAAGLSVRHESWFDTVTVDGVDADAVLAGARAAGVDLRRVDDQAVGLTFDETSTLDLVEQVLPAFGATLDRTRVDTCPDGLPTGLRRDGRDPHPGGVQPLPHRARDAALPAPPRRPRPRPRPDDDPARVVHDEAQRDDGDGADHVAGVRRPAPLRTRRRLHRAAGADRRARAVAGRDHRLRRRQRAAQRREPGRARRAAGDPRLPPLPRRRAAHRVPDPVQRPRHERRQRRDGRSRRGGRRHRRPWQRRRRRPHGQARQGRRPPGRDHAHLPVDARRVRGSDRRDLRCRPRGRRAGVRRRRQPQRPRRHRQARPLRGRRQPPQPAQDVLHPPRRRRTRRRPGRRARPPRPVPARSPARRPGTAGGSVSPRRRSARPASCRSPGPTSP